MTAATIFDGGRPGNRRRPFADLFTASDREPEATALPRPDRPAEPTLSDYLHALEQTIQRAERTQIRETLVEVTPREVQRVIEKAAKAKARYLAATLDLAEVDGLPESKQIEMLEAARTRHEAMQAGVRDLMAALRTGHVKVAGVMPDGWPSAGDS
ncbi:hypothetical protein [Rhodovibrio salinarum]|uniref:Uncharacterized protein n=1 Tax=Rhodovibrio salinarum TaxID=1087 RepID=A0A934QF38_9PROT|nr:hypothetical protein [Rhodovibrio salinarum]MBK1695901.1 hypothetical protein [Rhodovibrio salinarum]